MTSEIFRDTTIATFAENAKVKFDQGQKEHGGLITDRPCLLEAQKEVIDLMFYQAGVASVISNVVAALINLENELNHSLPWAARDLKIERQKLQNLY